MKTLILGANGLIGRQFARLCRERGIAVDGTCHSRPEPGLIPFDLGDLSGLPGLLDRCSPGLVVDAVGLAGGVDFCERHPEAGRRIHVDAPRLLAAWCRDHGAALLYLSSDYVFDDRRPLCRETDEPRPLNRYGRLKREGEEAIGEILDRHLIARTTNVYGWDPDTATPNFLMQMARALSAGGKARAPAYLLGNPIQAGDLAAAMLDLQERGRYGLYHIVGPDRLSRLQWARKLARGLGLEEAAVEAIPAPPVGAVPRPFRVELATDRFRAASAVRPAGVDAGVLSFVAAMRGGDRRT